MRLAASAVAVVALVAPTGAPGDAQVVEPDLPAGSLDPTFNGTGVATTAISSFVEAQDVAVQTLPDGSERLVVYEPAGHEVWRFLPDGTLDTAFDGDGVAPVPFPEPLGAPVRIAVDPSDGSIVLGRFVGGTGIQIARLLATGAVDTAFSPGGADGDGVRSFLTVSTGACGIFPPPPPPQPSGGPDLVQTYTGFADIGVQSDGDIVVVGPGTREEATGSLCALEAQGAIMTTVFSNVGVGESITTTTPPGTLNGVGFRVPRALAVLPDDRVVVSATTRDADVDVPGTRRVTVVRYSPTLALDPTFDGDGIASINQGHPDGARLPIGVEADGTTFVAVDFPRTTVAPMWRLLHYDAGGAVTSGTVDLPTAESSTTLAGVAAVDGGWVAIGSIPHADTADEIGLASFAAGSLAGTVTTLAHPGPLVTDAGAAASATLADGSIRIAGRAVPTVFGIDGLDQIMLARLDPAGAFDPAFGPDANGYATHKGGVGDFGGAVAVLPDLRVLAAGRIPFAGERSEPTGFVLRHEAGGPLDPTFVRGDLPPPPAVFPGIEITRYAAEVVTPTPTPAFAAVRAVAVVAKATSASRQRSEGGTGSRRWIGAQNAIAFFAAQAGITIPVTSAADAGAGSFRAAIQAANAATEPVTLDFDPSLAITLTSGDITYTNDQPLTLLGDGSSISGGDTQRILVVSNAAAPLLHVEGLTISNGRAATGTNGGGAIQTTGPVDVVASTFTDNVVDGTAAGDTGGAIASGSGDVSVTNSMFSRNAADAGGAIHLQGNPAVLDVSQSIISENTATASGGALVAIAVNIANSQLLENQGSGGGAVFGGTITVTESIVSDNVSANGDGGAIASTTATISASTVTNNAASPGGGGAVATFGTVSVANSVVGENTATEDGGAILAGGAVIVTGSVVQDNSADNGGAIRTPDSDVTVTGSTVTGNVATEFVGGAIYADGVVDVDDSVFGDNVAATNGGAIYAESDPGVRTSGTVTASVFSNNILVGRDPFDPGDGGAIRVEGTITVEESVFSGGFASHGGAIYADTVTATGSTFSDNTAQFLGGALHATEGASITTSTFDGNVVVELDGLGGAIYSFSDVDLTIDSSTFSGNEAGVGGAVYSEDDVDAVNSTFSGNSSLGAGGAIWAFTQATLTFVTIDGNDGPSQLAIDDGDPVTEASFLSFGTVIAEPTTGANCAIALDTASSHSYDTDGSCGFAGEGDTSGGGDPLLGDLADNGGGTLTMLPVNRSPLVSAVANAACVAQGVTLDQRGQPRPQGVLCEIGAVEVVGPGLDMVVDGMAVQDDGRVVIAGSADNGDIGAVHRLLADGGPDPTFNLGSPFLIELDCCGTAFHDVAIDAQGRIVAVGETRHVNGDEEDTLVAVRLLADGTPDPDFGDGGLVRIEQAIIAEEASARAVALDPAGRIVLAGFGSRELCLPECSGEFRRQLLVARLLDDGQPDATLGTDPNFGPGVILAGLDFFGSEDQLAALDGTDVVVDADRIVVSGILGTQFCSGLACFSIDQGFVGQLTPGGAPDAAFGTSGLALPFPIGSRAMAVAFDAIGQVVVAGGVTTSSGGSIALARLIGDGTNDPGFGSAGLVTTAVGNGTAIADDVTVAPDARIVVVGQITDDRSTRVVTARYVAGAVLQCVPTAVELGPVVLETAPATRTVTCTNTGPSAVSITAITVVGTDAADFTPTTTACLVTLPVGASCQLPVSFAPTAVGARTATLTVAYRGQGVAGPTTVALRGTGIARDSTLVFDPTELVFPEQLGLSTSEPLTVTVTNVGTIPVTISVVAIDDDPLADFAIAPTSTCDGATLLPGASCTVSVTITPQQPGPRTATLRFDHTGTSAPARIPLRGTGSTPVLLANPGVAPARSVVAGLGTLFPPNQPITLTWAEVDGSVLGTFVEPPASMMSAADGTLTASMPVFPHSRTGTRLLTATIGAFTASAPVLVVPTTAQPPDFVSRG